MILNEYYKLTNDVMIPKLGLGTWMIDDAAVTQVITNALDAGYRHIDTAQAYGNEAGIGKALASTSIPRNELFITTKVAAEAKSYRSAYDSISESLAKLGLDYLDLILIHAPQPWSEFREANYDNENIEVWRALEDVHKQGKVKAIGVSNFTIDDLNNILNHCTVKPMVNQILTHISNTPLELIQFCKNNDILCEAYSPIAHGEILKNQTVADVAAKYNTSIAQLCIAYTLQLGMVSLPKTATKSHMIDNATIDFVISDDDMEMLKNIERIKDYGEYSFFPVFNK